MSPYKLISSDSHVFEPPDLWENRIEPAFRDRAPRVVREEHTDQWYADGDFKFGVMGTAFQVGQRFEDASKLSVHGRHEDVPRGGYDPHAHIEDLDLDGVAADVIYPSEGLAAYLIPASDLLSAIFRAYNDWLADFCKPYPDRLKGVALLNVDDVSDGVREMERASRMGLVGAMIPVAPLDNRYDNPVYEPLWAAAEDLEMPLSLHAATFRAHPGETFDLEGLNADPVMFTLVDTKLRESLASIIFSGVFERYPKLRVGAVEFEVSWAAYFLGRLDDTYKYRAAGQKAFRFKEGILPSDFFRSNVFVSFQEDELAVRHRDIIGVDNLMWGSDYPHGESTFPRSREIVESILDGIPEDEKAKIAGGNCARLYDFRV